RGHARHAHLWVRPRLASAGRIRPQSGALKRIIRRAGAAGSHAVISFHAESTTAPRRAISGCVVLVRYLYGLPAIAERSRTRYPAISATISKNPSTTVKSHHGHNLATRSIPRMLGS